MVDLHTHSTASDGTLTPEQIISLCSVEGITTVALTDHDTVDGITSAARAGATAGVEVIGGVELEIEYTGSGAFHLLGLGIVRVSRQLSDFLDGVRRMRRERNDRMVERMREAGISVDHDEVSEFAAGDILARPHFARFLIERGVARSVQDAFDRFLGDGKAFWEPKGASPLEEATSAIHSAGGIAVIAHPMTLYLSMNGLERQVVEWKKSGLDGIEAYHSNTRLADCRRIETIALSHGLIVTAGSDYHGPQRTDRRLGRTAEGAEIEERFAAGIPRWPLSTGVS